MDIWHDLPMPTLKRKRRLLDAYRFAGFRPLATIQGVFGDPKARVITLVRRSKKRSATAVDGSARAGTTANAGVCAICRAATRAFISNSRCGVSSADAAAR